MHIDYAGDKLEILERGNDVSFKPTEEAGTARDYKPQKHKNIRGKGYYSNTS